MILAFGFQVDFFHMTVVILLVVMVIELGVIIRRS